MRCNYSKITFCLPKQIVFILKENRIMSLLTSLILLMFPTSTFNEAIHKTTYIITRLDISMAYTQVPLRLEYQSVHSTIIQL